MELILVEKEGVVPKPSSSGAAEAKAPKKKESKKKIARKNAQNRE